MTGVQEISVRGTLHVAKSFEFAFQELALLWIKANVDPTKLSPEELEAKYAEVVKKMIESANARKPKYEGPIKMV